jgi:hypothetical protein
VADDTYDVFVSYSRADGRHAAEIDSVLRDKGLKAFFDRRNLAAGLPWVRALEQAIGAAKAAIMLIGPRGLGNRSIGRGGHVDPTQTIRVAGFDRDCLLLRFLDQIARSPQAARELIQRLSQRLRQADDRIVNDGRRSNQAEKAQNGR